MPKLTSSGVCYDLEDSPYTTVVDNMTFNFSSLPHKSKFDRKAKMRIEWLNDSMSRRFNMQMRLERLALLQWYQMVETRGFLVEISGKKYRRSEDICVFSGLLLS